MSRRPARLGRPRVLCVDDEPGLLKLVERLLERMDLEVATAATPIAALALFDAEHFDLVVTDIRMPGMDGHAFLAEIRSRDPQVPVIVATLRTVIAYLSASERPGWFGSATMSSARIQADFRTR